jgi:hypothetical protein
LWSGKSYWVERDRAIFPDGEPVRVGEDDDADDK